MPDPNNNPVKVITLDTQVLAQGQTIRFDADREVKSGGVAIELEAEGVIEVGLCKEGLVYTLHNNGTHRDRLGTRFINRKGIVTLHGVEASKIKSAKIYFYEF
jgi:hypothetical protein